jgi:hypothetical protein
MSYFLEGSRWRIWLRHCATSRKVASSISGCHWNFLIDLILLAALCSGVNSDSERNKYQGYLLGVKAAGE